MHRREAVQLVALVLGGAVVGADAFLTGCHTSPKRVGLFSQEDITLLDEVGDTILPATPDSPGAREARIGEFMRTIVTDCYTIEDQDVFTKGIGDLENASYKAFGKDFMELSATDRGTFLAGIDKEAAGQPKHYFTLMKQLTLWGYFTSEVGATKALRYVLVPGRYDGDYPYKKGDKAWAL